jgi:hypothetical protein
VKFSKTSTKCIEFEKERGKHMKIPKVVIKNKQEYEFVKRNNATTFLYKNKKYGFKETFTLYQLGVIKEEVSPDKKSVHPENVKI